MEKDCGHYFLTADAVQFWRTGNQAGLNKMYECLYKEEKEKYFGSVLYRNSPIPWEMQRDMAEQAFSDAWLNIWGLAKDAPPNIEKADYRGFFYRTFKFSYFKLVNGYLKIKDNEEKYEPGSQQTDGELISGKMLNALNQLGKRCRTLIILRFVEERKIGQIAEHLFGQVTDGHKDYVTKMLWRCKKNLLNKWNNSK